MPSREVMKNIKTLSSEEIIEKYDITVSQMDLWSCGKKPFVPVHGNKFNAKWRRTVKVYAAHDVEAFFKKAGIRRRNPRKPIVSLTDASVILGVTYSMAKKLVNVDDRFRRLVIDITKKTYSFKRSDVLWYKKNIFDKEGCRSRSKRHTRNRRNTTSIKWQWRLSALRPKSGLERKVMAQQHESEHKANGGLGYDTV
jgi:hypothetical protein